MSQTLAWILVLVTAGSVGLLAYVLLERRRKGEASLPSEWLLTPRPVFNDHEKRVHRQLREALPQQVVLAKLPLIRFCQPADPAQVRFWFELLGAIHVSFAVCNANGRVLAAIDLEDGRGGARRALQIKQAVLAACHIRYVRYAAEQTPSVPELQLLVPAAAAQWPGVAVSTAAAAHVAASAPAGAVPAAAVLRNGLKLKPPSGFERDTRPQGLARHARWPDSGYLKDSTFGRDSVISGFSNSLPSVLPERDGKVVDHHPAQPTRH
ncbi:MAG: DUF2726 domain-containing protein [Rubrivivax sp.]|nr:DUF2726 domain-containing protein [Rubrivivax sp.]